MTAILPDPALGPAPAPRRGARRPPLHVVRTERSPLARRARARLLGVLVLLVVGVALFGLVASHVALTQGQFQLDRLEVRAAEEQARYERLRLQVAELESPARVVAAAQERLGMVPPPGVTYLSPVGPTSGTGGGGRDGAEAATEEWATVKRQLASRP
jgi:cell division protein FtsL